MRNLKTRLEALEGKAPEGLQRWHRIIVGFGQSEAEATTIYEVENGPLTELDAVILRVVI